MKVSTILLIFLGSFQLALGQESSNIILERQVVSNAGFVSGQDGSSSILMSWTLGQPVISTLYTPDSALVLTQGFQQPDVDLDVSYSTITTLENLKIKVFPNPVRENLFVNILDQEPDILGIRILDLNGKVIYQKEMHQNFIEIPMGALPKAMYLLEIKSNNYLATAKILKL